MRDLNGGLGDDVGQADGATRAIAGGMNGHGFCRTCRLFEFDGGGGIIPDLDAPGGETNRDGGGYFFLQSRAQVLTVDV